MSESTKALQVPAATPPAKRPRRWGGIVWFLAGTATLLAMVVAAYGLAWPWLLGQWQRLDALEQSIAAAEIRAEQSPDVQEMVNGLMEARVAEQRTRAQRDWQGDLANFRAQLQAERAESVKQLSGRMGRVEDQLDRLLAVDRRAWLGQEAVFLVRLASQRLLVARDIDAAMALLTQADGLLVDTGEPQFEAARMALAQDRAALAAIPRVDQVGLYARLAALVEQAAQLQLAFEVSEQQSSSDTTAHGGWWARAVSGWRAALAKLSDHLVIRRRSDEVASLMTPEWAALARQNLRMLLEQAQIAMLSANQALFEQSLVRSGEFVQLFIEHNPDRVGSIQAELLSLRNESVAPALTDLTRTRSLLESEVARLGERPTFQ